MSGRITGEVLEEKKSDKDPQREDVEAKLEASRQTGCEEKMKDGGDEISSESSTSSSEDSDDEMKASGNSESGTNIKHKFKAVVDTVTRERIDSLSPEQCIERLRNADLQMLPNLKIKLRQKDRHWTEEFLDLGGLQLLFDKLEVLGDSRMKELIDVLMISECIQCVKAIVYSKLGREFLMAHAENLNSLVKSESMLPSYMPREQGWPV